MQMIMSIRTISMIALLFFCVGLQKAFAIEREVPELLELFQKNYISKDGELIVFRFDDVNKFSDNDWDKLNKNHERIANKDKIIGLYLLGGNISKNSIEFFSKFKNVNTVIIGEMVDGAYTSKDSLAQLRLFKNLECLTISTFEIDDSCLSFIPELEKLKSLVIRFPASNPDPKKCKLINEPPFLTDNAVKFIAKSQSLESVVITGAYNTPRMANFTMSAVDEILLAKNLNNLEINKSFFDPDNQKKLDKRQLPDYVKIK